ncbi:MAG: prepilin-type N-terminal cleavage/methylation domain-containing protein [Pedobacter sp.]|nr:MAG: prepilin-type N-terminal cleavage/methylation domain-containing protein [Pedobacter sp.]
MNNTSQSKGFTIVELLIVIVVIGILAAITIVAFNGIQNRGKTAQYQSDVTNIDKKAEAYNINKSAYPVTSSTSAGAVGAAGATTGATAVTALFNATDSKESNLPSNIGIAGVLTAAAGGTAPTHAQAKAAIDANASINAYYVSYCSTGGGFKIYYPDLSTTSTVKEVVVGSCS